ncbi:MAG: hypothetical protein F2813_00385, partial [Actinobacteria bacterium]|nr:hypothetical protein [Actinomycetota bacterium]
DRMLIRSAAAAALIFPLVGTVVYVIVRPPEYIEDRVERELEMQAAAARLASTDYQACPHCEEIVAGDFLRCPHCMRKLRDSCAGCNRPLDPDWLLCPYCESEIEGVTPAAKPRLRGGRDTGRHEETVIVEEEVSFDDAFADTVFEEQLEEPIRVDDSDQPR